MTKIAIEPNASGSGTFTITSPNSNDNRTLTLPDEAGELLTDQRLATEAEAEAGTDNSKLMTPLRTAQAIAELSPQLTQTQAENPTSTVFGTVSGQRLEQQTNAAFNVTGAAPKFACRAWVNFDGTTSPGTIRASGNVSSVTRNGTGDYTVNFATAMPDANFSAVAVAGAGAADARRNTQCPFGQAPTTTSVRLETHGDTARFNLPFISVSIFR